MLPKKKHFFVAASEENQIVVAILQLFVDWKAKIATIARQILTLDHHYGKMKNKSQKTEI